MIANTELNQTVCMFLAPTKLPNVINDFLVDRDLRGVRPATIVWYRKETKIFITWAWDQGAQELQDLTADLLRAYFLQLRERRNTKAVFTNYSAVKTFLYWAWEEYELDGKCPISKVKVATPDNQPKPGVELTDVSRLINACSGDHAKRDRAIIYVLLDTGVRRSEVCALSIGSLESNGVISLSSEGTKTGQARKAFISRQTQKALRAYLITRDNLEIDAPLFATNHGGRFTTSGLRQVLRRLCVQAGIPEFGMHNFRRTFALESLRAGADVVSVSRLLGHSRVQTTMRYLNQNSDDLQNVHTATSPVDRLRNSTCKK